METDKKCLLVGKELGTDHMLAILSLLLCQDASFHYSIYIYFFVEVSLSKLRGWKETGFILLADSWAFAFQPICITQVTLMTQISLKGHQ